MREGRSSLSPVSAAELPCPLPAWSPCESLPMRAAPQVALQEQAVLRSSGGIRLFPHRKPEGQRESTGLQLDPQLKQFFCFLGQLFLSSQQLLFRDSHTPHPPSASFCTPDT